MLGWAQKRQPWRTLLIDGNPADLVEINKLVPSDYQEERTRILSSIELQELYQRFQKMTADYAALPAGEKYDGIRPLKPESQLALWICLGTLCRIGELLQAEWKNVDLENGVWFIPVANVKGSRGKSRTTTFSYLRLRSTISASFGCSQETLNGAFPQNIMMVMSISRSSANRWETANHASKIASLFHVADMMTPWCCPVVPMGNGHPMT